MTGAVVSRGDDAGWSIGFGYYHETYERRGGRWLFTSSRWHDYIGMGLLA